ARRRPTPPLVRRTWRLASDVFSEQEQTFHACSAIITGARVIHAGGSASALVPPPQNDAANRGRSTIFRIRSLARRGRGVEEGVWQRRRTVAGGVRPPPPGNPPIGFRPPASPPLFIVNQLSVGHSPGGAAR